MTATVKNFAAELDKHHVDHMEAISYEMIPSIEMSDSHQLCKTPLVSVAMITYNHEPYIRTAIEGIIAQKTDFSFELIIGEDCSTDNTRKIVLEYQKEYPIIIRVIISDNNVGMHKNCRRTIDACRGKYIAFCEGDDYWIEGHKLSKQVAILEKYADTSLCGAWTQVQSQQDIIGGRLIKPERYKDIYNLNDAMQQTLFHTSTMVIRKSVLRIPERARHVVYMDRYVRVLCAVRGDIRCIPEVVSVYRLHNGGVSTSETPRQHIRRWYQIHRAITELVGVNYPGMRQVRLDIAAAACGVFALDGHNQRARSLFYKLLWPLFCYKPISLLHLLVQVWMPIRYARIKRWRAKIYRMV